MKKSVHYKMATLFSGAGGLDTGFIKTGKYEMLMANDILTAPALTYSKNHHHRVIDAKKFSKKTKLPVYVVGDISTLNFEPLGKLDCIVGGPPCQDFSITRGGSEKRKGITVTRGALYLQYVRALKETCPKVFAFENVPGLVSANGGVAYETIIDDFTHLKQNGEGYLRYSIAFNKVVSATDVGVPQSRRRLIIIGMRTDLLNKTKQEEIHRYAEDTLTGKSSLVSRYPLTAMEAFEGKTIPELADKYKDVMEEYEGAEKIARTQESAKWKKKVWDSLTLDAVDDYLFLNKIKRLWILTTIKKELIQYCLMIYRP